jgi:hypothetical protein
MHLFPLPVPAAFRFDQRLIEQSREIVGMGIRSENNVAPFSPIAAVGTAPGNKFFPAKTDASAPPVARFGVHPDPVDEHVEY